MNHQRLWQAILLQAVVDAVNTGNFDYFRPTNRDFIFVCWQAGIDFRYVLKGVSDPEKMLSGAEILKKNNIRRGWQVKKPMEENGEYLEYFLNLEKED